MVKTDIIRSDVAHGFLLVQDPLYHVESQLFADPQRIAERSHESKLLFLVDSLERGTISKNHLRLAEIGRASCRERV